MAARKTGSDIEAARAARLKDVSAKYRLRHRQKADEERAMRRDQARLGKRWGHKHAGTPETHEKASNVRQGALARLYTAGQIDIEQLAASQSIRDIHERLARGLGIRTVSMETRVDVSRTGNGFFEALGAVRREVAYSRWRAALPRPAPVLAMIVEDLGVSAVARCYRMRKAAVRPMLSDALDLWQDEFAQACKEIDEADVLAAHSGIL